MPLHAEPRQRRLRFVVGGREGAGIGLQISCIHGNPGETPEQMFQTLDMADKIKPTQNSAYIFYPFPNTKMYDACVKTGYLDAEGEEKVRQGISGYHHEAVVRTSLGTG